MVNKELMIFTLHEKATINNFLGSWYWQINSKIECRFAQMLFSNECYMCRQRVTNPKIHFCRHIVRDYSRQILRSGLSPAIAFSHFDIISASQYFLWLAG